MAVRIVYSQEQISGFVSYLLNLLTVLMLQHAT